MPDHKSTIQDILRSGLTLLAAADAHAPRSLTRKLANIKPSEEPYLYPGIKKMAEGMEAPRQIEFLEAAKSMSSTWSHYKAEREIIWAIRAHLRDKLSSGALIAYGFETADPKCPSQIPSYLFEHGDFIDWQNSSVEGNGLQYLSVKVLLPDQMAALDPHANDHSDNHNGSKGGRPTSKLRVSEAIWAIMNANRNFAGLPIKTQISEVKKYVLKNHPDEFPGSKGLSDKTVGSHIRSLSGRKLPPKS